MNEKKRKLLLVKITESDGVTPKVAKPSQSFSYDELLNKTFVEGYEIELGYSALLIPLSDEVLNGINLRTSTIQMIEESEEDFVKRLIITTMNTIYYFDVIE